MITLSLSALALAAGGALIDRRADWCEARAEARFPPTGQFIEVNGASVHAHVEGEGPDLVLIHGASGSTRDYTHTLVAQLESDYRVIVLDRPGFGYTPRLHKDGESLEEQAALLSAAAAELGIEVKRVENVPEYDEGEAIMEGLNTPHNGVNNSDSPVKVLVVNIGSPDAKNSVKL